MKRDHYMIMSLRMEISLSLFFFFAYVTRCKLCMSVSSLYNEHLCTVVCLFQCTCKKEMFCQLYFHYDSTVSNSQPQHWEVIIISLHILFGLFCVVSVSWGGGGVCCFPVRNFAFLKSIQTITNLFNSSQYQFT